MWILAGDTTILQYLPSLELYIVGEKWEVVELRGRMLTPKAVISRDPSTSLGGFLVKTSENFVYLANSLYTRIHEL